ncbi:hypothetical protein BJ170DRAFT_132890 [Xylariales sp. AK1849]|nr:hypothetical protein BJ170DRAFT_132890 [Xylariales sp. AK1849]
MSKLPLKVQVGIRSSWERAEAPVQKALKDLKDLLGIDVIIQPEWPLLLAELDSSYPDKSTFAPSIAGCVQAWCTALTALLDDSANEKWADTLLDHANGRLLGFLDVSKDRQPAVKWSSERSGFIINPPQGHMASSMEIEPLFIGQLLRCFDEKANPALVNDWADVSMDASTGQPAISEDTTFLTPEFHTLPGCATLARPDELVLKPPYHLVVHDRGTTLVEVQGSHSPSLVLLSEYLKKWCRVNHQDSRKPPCVEVKLHQAAFGIGLIYDRLTLSAEGRYASFSITPMIVLSLVEGVLGYKSVSVDGNSYRFRKDVEFRAYGH